MEYGGEKKPAEDLQTHSVSVMYITYRDEMYPRDRPKCHNPISKYKGEADALSECSLS